MELNGSINTSQICLLLNDTERKESVIIINWYNCIKINLKNSFLSLDLDLRNSSNSKNNPGILSTY